MYVGTESTITLISDHESRKSSTTPHSECGPGTRGKGDGERGPGTTGREMVSVVQVQWEGRGREKRKRNTLPSPQPPAPELAAVW